jgi:hypothetical protein
LRAAEALNAKYVLGVEIDEEFAKRAELRLWEARQARSENSMLDELVVGDLIRSGEAQERGIVGETPNLAARLQGIAEPNAVVIAESTRKLAGNLFELEDLGAQELKGITGAVGAWTVLRPASVEGRFDALHATGLTEHVGREEELELLLRRWSRAKTGEGQVVLLTGGLRQCDEIKRDGCRCDKDRCCAFDAHIAGAASPGDGRRSDLVGRCVEPRAGIVGVRHNWNVASASA